MTALARLSKLIPVEENVGGYHRTVRYVVGPPLIAVGVAVLLGFVPALAGLVGTAVGAFAVFAGVVSLVEAETRKCPGYTVLGVNTCEISTVGVEEGDDGRA